MNPTCTAGAHTHISGGYDVADREARNLPPSQEVGLWLLQLEGQYAARHKALGTRELQVVLTSHTHTHTHTHTQTHTHTLIHSPRGDRDSQSLLATRTSYPRLTLSGWTLAHLA